MSLPQENVWDYPRPPRLEPFIGTIRIVVDGQELVHTTSALRLLETSHPPSYYIPQADTRMDWLVSNRERTFCEFKGVASYWDLAAADGQRPSVAWSYPDPTARYAALKDYLAFYPGRVDECWVNDERVLPQAGSFYGGWLTSNLIGPFKGGPGTAGW